MSTEQAARARQQLTSRAEKALRSSGADSPSLLELAGELEEHHLSELAVLVRRREILERAWQRLRQPGGDADDLFTLAKELKKQNLFGAARRVLERARRVDPEQRLELIQQHALCTYKDPDVPAHRALDDALRILEQDADLARTQDAETLGLAGAIFKRKWHTDGDKQHLESSLAYYFRGYQQGTPSERGYTGINAAYVLELLAHVEDEQARETTGGPSPTAIARRTEAKRIREELVELLKPADESAWGDEDTKLDWWACATLAEAHFGLGPYDAKGVEVEESHYGKAQGWIYKGVLTHQQNLSRWEFESTARQLASLAHLQVGDELQTPAWEVIRQLVGDDAEALVGAVFKGKLGIGLSGGGFRASLFHIGVLARLAELDLLRHVEVFSCVSGGSILGAYYYLKVRQLLEEKEDGKIRREDYVQLVQAMARDFLASVQRNMRTRVVSNLFDNWKMAASSRYSRSDRLAELYEKHIYSLLGPAQTLTMDELGIRPLGQHFVSRGEDNWRRQNKVPGLVLNATILNTGHNWQFTTSFMGESAFSVDEEIDGNWLLRRLNYWEAPAEHQKIPLGQAVGASACVPGLFEPIALHDLYPKDTEQHPKMVVRLVDGGVHDNQGVVSLIEQDCSVIVVSDASGQMTSDPEPGGGFIAPLLRTNSVLMERVRQSQFQDLKARLRAGLLKGLMIVHMKKAFDVEAIDWRTCNEPPTESDGQQTDFLPYGVRKELQAMLAAVRTDLDSFSDIEGHALMTSGYLMAKEYADKLGAFLDPEAAEWEPEAWEFMRLEEPLRYDAAEDRGGGESSDPERAYSWVKKNLEVAAKGAFRVFSLSPALKWMSYAVLAAVAIVMVLWGGLQGAIYAALGVAAIFLIAKGSGLLKTLLGLVLSLPGSIAAGLHLWFFDRWFLKVGRLPDSKRRLKSSR
jgi:predicted acylesterase/phospholipase RssA